MACINPAVLSILAATSMPVGKAGPPPASVNAGKQSALPAGAEVAASESSGSSDNSSEANFQKAFSSALHESTAPAAGKSKSAQSDASPQAAQDTSPTQKGDTETTSGTGATQSVLNKDQAVTVVLNALTSRIASPTALSTILDDSKAPASTVSLPPKEQVTSKPKAALQSEPVDPKPAQSSTDTTNAALISSVAALFAATTTQPHATAQAAVLNRPTAASDQFPVPPAASVLSSAPASGHDLPPAQVIASQTAAAAAPEIPSVTQSTVPDSLSFALLLHPKLAQGPITTTQSVPIVKQASDQRNTAPAKTPPIITQTTDTDDSDSRIPIVAAPAGSPSGQTPQSDRSAPLIAAPSQTHNSTRSVISSGPQQPSNSAATVFQTHSSQNSPSSSDQPGRGKTESPSDENSSASVGASDIAKPIMNATSVIPNAPVVHSKTAETVNGTAIPAQVINAENQAPATAAKEVVLRLQGQTGEAISVRLVDQGGQVQVAVRSSDPATANLLRQDLSSLTNNLDRAGWKPEVLAAAPIATSVVREANSGSGSGHDGQNSQGQGQGPLDWSQQDSSRRRNTVADLWDEILTRQGT